MPDIANQSIEKTEGHLTASKSDSDMKRDEQVYVGEFLFDLSVVSRHDVMLVRKYLPYKTYNRLKNRFSARASRIKKKVAAKQTEKRFEQGS